MEQICIEGRLLGYQVLQSILTERSSEDVQHVSVNGQKKGFTVSISNLLKRTAKFLIAYFLVQNSDVRSQRVVDDFSMY